MTTLKELNACEEGQEWADAQTDYRTAWNTCERGDWMLWIAKKRNIDLKILTLAKVKCARLVQHLMKDERSLKALDVAEKFARGEATREELNVAADAADDAAAAYAADAAYAAAAAAAYAADAAYAAAYAYAAAAGGFASKKEILKKCADICREVIDFDLLRMEAQQ